MMVFDSSAIYKSISLGKTQILGDQYTTYLAFYELGNVVWKNTVLTKVYSPKESQELLSVVNLVLEKMRVGYVDLKDTYVIAASQSISFYDAAYVSLAARLKCPLVTLDSKLIAKVESIVTVMPFESVLIQ